MLNHKLSSLLLIVILACSTLFVLSSTVLPKGKADNVQSNLSQSEALLGAGALWAANGGSRAAYVDLYDNMMAHPNTALAGGNASYYLPLKNEVLSVLQAENFTVDCFADIPGNLSQYSLVYLEAYFACDPSFEPAIRSYVFNGGGLLVWQGAVCYLAYYSKTSNTGQDLSWISDWFGASYYVNTGGSAYVTVQNPLGSGLTQGEQLVQGVGYSDAAITAMSADSQVLATWGDGSTFAFTHAYGQGRVYWQATQFRVTDPQTPGSQNPPPSNPPPSNTTASQQAETYFSVEPVAVAPLINANASVNGLEVPYPPLAVVQNFTVNIHLMNATQTNVAAGVCGVEVHFDFSDILGYCKPVGFTTMLGQQGGALSEPLIYALNGFYDSNGNPVTGADLSKATQYEVAAAGAGWNGNDGLVAQITFQIIAQPSESLNQTTFYGPLNITFAQLQDFNNQNVPFYIVQGTLKIDDPTIIPGDLNYDGKVSLVDLVTLAISYGSTPSTLGWNPNADINGDGKVNLTDIVILAEHYGQHMP